MLHVVTCTPNFDLLSLCKNVKLFHNLHKNKCVLTIDIVDFVHLMLNYRTGNKYQSKLNDFCNHSWQLLLIMYTCVEYTYMLQKLREEKIGTICKDYVDLKEKFKELGKGGFGKVYEYKQPDSEKLFAIKVEEKVQLYNLGQVLLM